MPTRGRGRERREKGEKRKEGVPSYDACVQGHTKGREEKVPSYDKSIQGHPRREEGEREGKKERERERKGEERKKKKAGVPSYEQASRDTPKKERGDRVAFRKTPGSKERKGEGKGEKGAKVPTGSNELQKYFDRCGHLVPCRSGWLLRPLRSRKGMSQLGIPKMRQNRSSGGMSQLLSAADTYISGQGR